MTIIRDFKRFVNNNLIEYLIIDGLSAYVYAGSWQYRARLESCIALLSIT